MAAILSLLVVLSLSILMTRIATLALTHTGLSRQSSRFQARSAFTGVGYTTSESEKLVNHPQRRRILFTLMLMGNAGIVTVISTFILGFLQPGEGWGLWVRILVLGIGVGFLITLASSSRVDSSLSILINRLLRKYTDLNVMDYAALLHLGGEYAIHELFVKEKDWLADQPLADLKLNEEGVLVLSVTRSDATFIGTPDADTRIRHGDTLILYGRSESIVKLDRRGKGIGGQLAHAEAVSHQSAVSEQERQIDPDTDSAGQSEK